MENQLPNHIVYSPNVIEFTTVVAETCLFLEHVNENTKADFIRKSVKLLPLLYLKVSLIDVPEPEMEDVPERFVTEDDYMSVREEIKLILGADDSYLEVFHPDIAYSDTPIAAFISENLADVYQEIKDYAANYRIGEEPIMNDALVVCIETFGEHWGQKLLNVLRALHALRYGDALESENTDEPSESGFDRNRFLDFQQDFPNELI